MRKSFKRLGMSAAALLAIAPSIVSSGLVSADTTVSNIKVSGNEQDEDSETNDLMLTLAPSNTASLKDGSSAADIKASLNSNFGQPQLKGKVYTVKTKDLAQIHDIASAKKHTVNELEGGVSYTLVADNIEVSGLDPQVQYSYNDQKLPKKATSYNVQGLVRSTAFIVKDSNLDIQPYFSQNQNEQNIALANGAQANAISANGISNVKDALAAALKAVKINDGQNAKDSKAVLVTNTADIKSQLIAQKIKIGEDGQFTVPAAGFNLVLTIANNASGKTATVTIPFKGQTDPNSDMPQFEVNGEKYSQPRFFVVRANNKDTNKNTATEFTDLNGKKVTFTAVENADSKQKVKITGNGANFKTPGQYTVTLTATNAKGKTSQAVYTLVVLGESTQRVYANGAKGVATYSLEGGQVKKLDTVLKDNQPITVEGAAKVVNGVSYTRIKTDDGKEYYVQTANLTKQENAYQKDKEVAHTYKLMHAAYIYDKNGKRVGQSILPSYIQITTYGNPVKINNGVYYKIAENQYVKAGNIFGSHRTFVKNAFIYKNNGKAYTYKTTVKRHGKRVRVTRHNNYRKGEKIITFGAHFNIKGHKMYRISKNQYIKAGNLSAPVTQNVSVSVPKTTSQTNTDNGSLSNSSQANTAKSGSNESGSSVGASGNENTHTSKVGTSLGSVSLNK